MKEGNFLGGFLLGLFAGLVGLIVAICLKEPQTKKGALVGFACGLSFLLFCFLCFWIIIFIITLVAFA